MNAGATVKNMKLENATTEKDLEQIRQLYMISFPDSERKPFGMILDMQKSGHADVFKMMDPGFCGLLITMKNDDLLLVDYLAVDPASHSQGHGSKALEAFSQIYPGRPVVLEIEDPKGTAPDSVENRRLSFYLRNGFRVMDYTISLFDVPMKILVRQGSVTFDQYKSFLLDRLGGWADSHILLVEQD